MRERGGLPGRGASLARDIERINRALRDGLRIAIGATGDHRRPGGRGDVGPVVVMSVRDADGTVRAALRPMAAGRDDRKRRLALAGVVAECAMVLGLGTGIYRSGKP